MMACCVGCYSQYLNADGTINNPALDKAKYDYRVWAETKTKLKPGQINDNVAQLGDCRCDCHIIGSSVMH